MNKKKKKKKGEKQTESSLSPWRKPAFQDGPSSVTRDRNMPCITHRAILTSSILVFAGFQQFTHFQH